MPIFAAVGGATRADRNETQREWCGSDGCSRGRRSPPHQLSGRIRAADVSRPFSHAAQKRSATRRRRGSVKGKRWRTTSPFATEAGNGGGFCRCGSVRRCALVSNVSSFPYVRGRRDPAKCVRRWGSHVRRRLASSRLGATQRQPARKVRRRRRHVFTHRRRSVCDGTNVSL